MILSINIKKKSIFIQSGIENKGKNKNGLFGKLVHLNILTNIPKENFSIGFHRTSCKHLKYWQKIQEFIRTRVAKPVFSNVLCFRIKVFMSEYSGKRHTCHGFSSSVSH